MRPCADVATIRDGLHVDVAGEILVRQKPGSAEGELLIAIEDETGVDQGILWPDRFETRCRTSCRRRWCRHIDRCAEAVVERRGSGSGNRF